MLIQYADSDRHRHWCCHRRRPTWLGSVAEARWATRIVSMQQVTGRMPMTWLIEITFVLPAGITANPRLSRRRWRVRFTRVVIAVIFSVCYPEIGI
jgi:hypothetical protein